MTEDEWIACEDPERLFMDIAETVTKRKLQLFSVSCCRRIWHLITDPRSRAAVEVAERDADGLAGKRERSTAMKAALAARSDADGSPFDIVAFNAAFAAFLAVHHNMDHWTARDTANAVSYALKEKTDHDTRNTQPAHTALARDVFRFPGHVSRERQAEAAQVKLLAQGAYEERHLPAGHLDLARLAVLTDALEEAGCADAEILAHLRSSGPHVRGCWALDLILGKE